VRESRADRTLRTNSNAQFGKYKFATAQLPLTSRFVGGAVGIIRTDWVAIARRSGVVNMKKPRKRGRVVTASDIK